MAGASIKIAPSILSADFGRLGEQVQDAERAGADYLHVDIMDGRFVPPISFGAMVVKAIRPLVRMPLDVHLMIRDPDRYLQEFADAGADILTVHVEAAAHLHRTLETIRRLGLRAGVAVNPATPLVAVEEALYQLDLVNLGTVDPGFAGQEFIAGVLPKIQRMRSMLDGGGYGAELEVDGGINEATASKAVKAGARVLVAGSAVFNGRDTVESNLRRVRTAAESALGEGTSPLR
jgi:ribulose-phosphate 3-epimerase